MRPHLCAWVQIKGLFRPPETLSLETLVGCTIDEKELDKVIHGDKSDDFYKDMPWYHGVLGVFAKSNGSSLTPAEFAMYLSRSPTTVFPQTIHHLSPYRQIVMGERIDGIKAHSDSHGQLGFTGMPTTAAELAGFARTLPLLLRRNHKTFDSTTGWRADNESGFKYSVPTDMTMYDSNVFLSPPPEWLEWLPVKGSAPPLSSLHWTLCGCTAS